MSTTTQRQRELIETEAELGLPLLGYTVVPSLKGIEVSRPDALAILTPLGLDDYLPGLPKIETCLKRAAKRWLRELSKNQDLGIDEDDDTMWRSITKRGDEIVALALVVEIADLKQWGLSYLTNLRIFYNKKNQMLSLTRTSVGGMDAVTTDKDLCDKLLPHFLYYQDIYVASDLSRMVCDMVQSVVASAMREKGGTYFVPAKKRNPNKEGELVSSAPDLQIIKDLIELQLPAGQGMTNTSNLSTFPVIDTKKSKGQMANLAHKSFVAELVAFKRDLSRFEEQIKKTSKIFKNGNVHHGKVKEETIVARLNQYKNMKTKISLYQETLGMRQDELLAELDALTKTANSLRETATDIMAEQEEGNTEQTTTQAVEAEEGTHTNEEEELAEA